MKRPLQVDAAHAEWTRSRSLAHQLRQPVDDVGVVRVEAVAAEVEGKALAAERAREAAHGGATFDDGYGSAGARDFPRDRQAGHAAAKTTKSDDDTFRQDTIAA